MNLIYRYFKIFFMSIIIVASISEGFAAAKCKGFANFINMSMRKDLTPARAYQITKSIHEVESADDIKIFQDGKESVVQIDKYEDGKLLYRIEGSDEVLPFDALNKDVREFFRINGEGPFLARAPEIQTELPLNPAMAGKQLEMDLRGGEATLPRGTEVKSRPDTRISRGDQPELPEMERQLEMDFTAPKAPEAAKAPVVQSELGLPPGKSGGQLELDLQGGAAAARTPEIKSAPDTTVTRMEQPKLPGMDSKPRQGELNFEAPSRPGTALALRGETALAKAPDAPVAPKAEEPPLLLPKSEAPEVKALPAPERLDPIPPDRALVVRPNTLPAKPVVADEVKGLDLDSIEIRGEKPLALPAPDAPVGRVIPGEPNFSLARVGSEIEFKSPAGNRTTRGKVLAVNEQSVKILDTNGVERTVRFRQIDSDTLKVVEPESVSIGRPSTGRPQPSRADFPDSRVGDTVTFTTPAGNKTISGSIVKVNDQSVRVLVNGKEETFRFRNINGDSIVFEPKTRGTALVAVDNAPGTELTAVKEPGTALVPVNKEPGTALVPADKTGTAIAAVDNASVPKTRGTDLDTVTLTGEIVDNTDIVPRQKPAGLLEAPFIEGTVNRTAGAIEDAKRLPARAETRPKLPTRVANIPDNLGVAFRNGQKVSFRTKDGNLVEGVFEGMEDGKALIRLEDGTVMRLDFNDINYNSIFSRLSPHSATPDDFKNLANDNFEISFKLGDEFGEGTAKSNLAASRIMTFFEKLGSGPWRLLGWGSDFVRVISKSNGAIKKIPLSVLKRNGLTMGVKRVAGVSNEMSRALGRYYRTLEEKGETPQVDYEGNAVVTTPDSPDDEPVKTDPSDPDPTPTPTPKGNSTLPEYDPKKEEVVDDGLVTPTTQEQQGPGIPPPQFIQQHRPSMQIKRGVY